MTEEIGDDLNIVKLEKRDVSGSWVGGTVAGYWFDALVFPAHAERKGYEIGDSRISKLWLQRLSDRTTVFDWDRGPNRPAADADTQAVVDFLCAGLADYVYRPFST
jgi:hypothetical protein